MTDSSRKKGRVQRTVLIVVVVVIFTAGLIVSIYDGIQKEKEFQYNRENYALALAALDRAEYETAYAYISLVQDEYEDAETLKIYLRARTMYDAERPETTVEADAEMDQISWHYYGERADEIEEFKKEMLNESSSYSYAQHRKKVEAEREYVRDKLPYVGMLEENIDMTFLGYHGEVWETREWVGDELKDAELYLWYVKEDLLLSIYSATVVDGSVIKVNKGNEKYWDGNTILGTPGGRPDLEEKEYTNSNWVPPASLYEDPYDAGSYSDPEDFYDDYYDDFSDYDEAEEYWYSYS